MILKIAISQKKSLNSEKITAAIWRLFACPQSSAFAEANNLSLQIRDMKPYFILEKRINFVVLLDNNLENSLQNIVQKL